MVYDCLCYRRSFCFFSVCLKKTSAFSHWCALMSLRHPNASLVEVKIVTLYVTETAKIKNMHESNYLLNVIVSRAQFGGQVEENND